MERVRLLTVEKTFLLEGPTASRLILVPILPVPVPASGWKAQTITALVVRPNGEQFETQAEISLSHLNIRDPKAPVEARWQVTVLLSGCTPAEVPAGSRILVPRDLRDALLGAKIPASSPA